MAPIRSPSRNRDTPDDIIMVDESYVNLSSECRNVLYDLDASQVTLLSWT